MEAYQPRRAFLKSGACGTLPLLAGCLGSSGGNNTQTNESEIELIEPDSDAGFHYPYFLLKPQAKQDAARPIFVQPHNAPNVTNREELRSQVIERVNFYLQIARELDLPGLVPAFPRTPNDGPDFIHSLALPSFQSDLLDRYTLEHIGTDNFPARSLQRVDKQFINMLADARNRLKSDGHTPTERIHMLGFSSSATFASRFALLYPNRVRSITLGGNGAHPLPKQSIADIPLPYPLGIRDNEAITGRQFDLSAWKNIHKFIFVGREDQPLPRSDQRGYWPISMRHRDKALAAFGENRVTERLPVTKFVYDDVGAHASFHVYAGVGHTYSSEMQHDTLEYHRKSVSSPPGETLTVAPENVPPKPSDLPTELPDSWRIEFARSPTAGDTHVTVNAAYPPAYQPTNFVSIRVFAGPEAAMQSSLRATPRPIPRNPISDHSVKLDPKYDAVPLRDGEAVTIALLDDPDDGPKVTATTTVSGG